VVSIWLINLKIIEIAREIKFLSIIGIRVFSSIKELDDILSFRTGGKLNLDTYVRS
jgi:hypothetical protein